MADDNTDKVNSKELYFAAFGPTLFVKNHMTVIRIPDRPYIQLYLFAFIPLPRLRIQLIPMKSVTALLSETLKHVVPPWCLCDA